MRIELSVLPGNSGLQHRGGPWLEVSPCPLVLSGIRGGSVAAAAPSTSRELGDLVAPPSHDLLTAHWLELASGFPGPAHPFTLPAPPPQPSPSPSPSPPPPPPAWSVVRGEGPCVCGFGSGPGSFLRRLGVGQRDALRP